MMTLKISFVIFQIFLVYTIFSDTYLIDEALTILLISTLHDFGTFDHRKFDHLLHVLIQLSLEIWFEVLRNPETEYYQDQ